MADGQVIITLSVKDAEAVRAWQRAKAGIGDMQQELRSAKSATRSLAGETSSLSKAQKDGFAAMSQMGKQAYQQQTAWGKGLMELDQQRSNQAAANAKSATGRIRAAAKGTGNAMRAAAGEVSKLGQEVSSTAASSVVGFASVSGAVTALIAGLRQAVSLTNELDSLRDQSTLTREEAQAKFMSQARTSGASREELKAIGQDVELRGAPYGHKGVASLAFAQEAASQGVNVKEIPAFLDVANKFAAAQGVKLDLDLFKSFVQAARVEDEGLSVQAADITAKSFFGAFLTRQLQPQQLEDFAKQNYGLKEAGLNSAQRIAANTAALDIYGGSADQAATFNRAFFSKLRSAEGRSEAKQSLAALGLETKDVDLIGEDVHQVLDRLAAAIGNAPQENRVPLLTKIFGEEYASQAMAFVQKRQKLRDIVKEIREGEKEFEPAAAELTSTRAAKQRMFAAETDIARSEHGTPDVETVRAAMLADMEKRGVSGFVQWAASKSFSVNSFWERRSADGATLEELVELAASEMAIGSEGQEAAKQRLRAALAPRSAATARARKQPATAGASPRQPPPKATQAAPTPQSPRSAGGAPQTPPAPPPPNEASSRPGQPAPRPGAELAGDPRKLNEQIASRAAAYKKSGADAAAAKAAATEAAAEARRRKADDRKTATLRRQAGSAGNAAAKLSQDAKDDDAEISELRRQLDFRRRVSAASTGPPTPDKAAGRGRKPRGRRPSAAAQLREHEAIRRLEGRIAEAERQRDEHQAAAAKKLDEQTALLQKIADSVANPQVTIKNPGDAARQSRATSPPRNPIGRATP